MSDDDTFNEISNRLLNLLEKAGKSVLRTVESPELKKAIDRAVPRVEIRNPAGPTGGPHGISIVAKKNDQSVFNVGAGNDEQAGVKDDGITGSTKSHVHFFAETSKTAISLGGPGAKSTGYMSLLGGDTTAANGY